MVDLAYLHQPFPLTPDEQALCRRVGTARFEYHRTQPWYRGWNLDGYVIGCAGELAVSKLCGIPWAQDTAGGDAGTDLPDTDVKGRPATHVNELRDLLRLADSPRWAPYYALVVVQSDLAWTRYVGWCTGAMLAGARQVELGHGPTCALAEHQLLASLPPPLATARQMKRS